MKLITFLLTVCCLQVAAYTSAQVTYKATNKPLHVIFTEVGKITGYNFFYRVEDLAGTKNVSVDAKDLSLEAFMRVCLLGQGLDFYVDGKTVVIEKKKVVASAVDKVVGSKDPIEVTVRVVNEEGEPVAGVTVQEKGTKNAVATNGEGVAKIKVDINDILVLTAVNIISVEAAVDGRKDFSVKVKGKTGKLDEVQVVAYGTTSQRLTTGNVSTVNASDLANQPVSNPLIALQGRIPGLFITQSTGLAGGAITALIQGQTSITSGNDPFYVIDGVPYTQQLLPSFGNILGSPGKNNTQAGNPLNFINTNDIESISVLKGADATAIYGSRAANGAIIITTKRGKKGETRVDLNIQQGWGKVGNRMNLLNTQEYLMMRKEAKANDNSAISTFDYDINGTWDSTRYTDWQKELIGKTTSYTNLNASIAGGSELTQFFVSTTYQRETAVFPGSFSNQKGSLHMNINNKSFNQKLQFQLSATFLLSKNLLPTTDLTQTALELPPNAPALLNNDGSINWALSPTGSTTWLRSNGNPLAVYTLGNFENKANNIVTNALISYRIASGLDIKSNIGYTNLQIDETFTRPLSTVQPALRTIIPRSGVFINNKISSWSVEPQINYSHSFNQLKFDLLTGFTVQQKNSNGYQISASGFNNDGSIKDINSAASLSHIGSTIATYKYNALFGRLNFNWINKYLLTLTGRRDGSSRFGSSNRFHNFGAVATGWVFSEENYFKDNLPFLTFGKLRSSYGTTGNDQIGDYAFMSTYSPVFGPVPYQDIVGLQPNGIPNPYLQWEETRKLEAALELGFLKDRLLFTFNYFSNRSSNQLLGYQLSIITGSTYMTTNFPAVVCNYGLEITASTKNFQIKDFTWNTSFNITLPKNKLIDFPNLANSIYANSLVIGKPISGMRLFHSLGPDPITGVYQFATKSGSSSSAPDYTTDANKFVNIGPSFYGGLQNMLSYKNIELDFLIQFVGQKAQQYYYGKFPGSLLMNQPKTVLNRWQKEGDIKPVQRYNADGSHADAIYYLQDSDAAYADASFLRLKTLSLSWKLPVGLMHKLAMQSAKLFIYCQNLLTITNYEGLDPETRGAISYTPLPPLRQFTFGINASF